MFASSFFSFKLLLKTFLAPWRRYNWKYPRGFYIKEFFNTFISNAVSRILGAIMRTFLIIAGALFQVFVASAGLIVFIGWLLVPFIIASGILFIIFF